jgi:molecular chaperone GrpE
MTEKNEAKNIRYKIKLGQKAVLYDEKQDKFLIAKVRDKEGWYYKNMGPWEFVGGTLEENELLIDSLKREVFEEAGKIDIEIKDIVNTVEFDTVSGKKIFLMYLIKYFGGDLRMSDEHSEFKWISADEIINNKKEYSDWVSKSIKKAAESIEKEKSLDSWKRCQADFENFKKDQSRHQEEFRKYAKMDVIEQILPVVDNFEASLAHVPEHSKENKWVEGIVYIKKQLEDVLKNNDIEEIAVKAGDKFNPEIHEAVGGDGKKQKVTRVIQKGYKLNGRILRAARVEVG